jgi:hypothetical protein
LKNLLRLTLPAPFLALLLLAATPALAQKKDESGARELMRLVNGERERAGMGALAWDDHIADAAMAHARLLVEHEELSHQFPGEPHLRDRMARAGVKFDADAENVAYDNSIEDAHTHLMQSKGHRANIMDSRYNAIGVAVLWRDGRVYVVEDFARKMADYSDTEVVNAVFASFNRARVAARRRPTTLVRDLHEAACYMAKKDRVTTVGLELVGAVSVVAFTTFQPEELPTSVQARVGESFSRVAIGACFARTESYPSGADWVVMAFYP